jgi:DNA helicase-2/ATP-dependent DNA helicase PcrA
MSQEPPHPEQPLEDAHLRETLAVVAQRRDEVGNYHVSGPTAHDAASLHRHLVRIYQELGVASRQAYFGRLDLQRAGKAEAHYLGRIGVERKGKIVVVDWRAPVARLFSRRRPGRVEFLTPDGPATAELQLKRHLQVAEDRLLSLQDEYDTRPDAPSRDAPRPALIDPDAYLRDILSGRHDVRMQDIVASIQEHQDDLIRADPDQVLVIQGVAGSGKTAMALHRVAFLLYPGHKLGFDAERCIIFGPNQMFLGYIANVLPGLGVGDIPQTTFEAWALERLGLSGRLLVDPTLDALLKGRPSNTRQRALVRRGQLKVSLRLGRVLERLAQWWRAQLRLPAEGLVIKGLGPLRVAAQLPKARLEAIHQPLAELPLARHRERFVELVQGELMGAYATAFEKRLAEMEDEAEELAERHGQLTTEAARLDGYAVMAEQTHDLDLEEAQTAPRLKQGADALRALAAYCHDQAERTRLRAARLREEGRTPAKRAVVREAVGQALAASLETIWPALDPLAAYRALLADPDRLAQLGKGLLTPEEVDLLAEAKPTNGKAVDVTDLPALAYLHLILNGVPAPLYDHVVVDEAQDTAPLYLAVLRKLTRNGSFTLLGDAAQSVYSYRGLASWDDAREALAGLPYTFAEVRESYRGTHEIITFANRILELLATRGQPPLLARPFERHGAPVRVERVAAAEAMPAALAAAVGTLQGQGFRNIALITKTAAQAEALAAALRDLPERLGDFQVALDASQTYEGGVLVLPVHLA